MGLMGELSYFPWAPVPVLCPSWDCVCLTTMCAGQSYKGTCMKLTCSM